MKNTKFKIINNQFDTIRNRHNPSHLAFKRSCQYSEIIHIFSKQNKHKKTINSANEGTKIPCISFILCF